MEGTIIDEKKTNRGRIFLLVGLIVIVFVAFALQLMNYQVVQADEYQQMAQGSYTSVQTIDAARGEILDRYGRPLAVNEVSYDIIINEAYLPNSMKNTVIERIIQLMEQEGQTWIDTLPISTTEPFTFLNESETQQRQLQQIKTDNKINLDADAQTTLDNLLDKYGLDEMEDKVMARKIAGVRYQMEVYGSNDSTPYTFSQDIPIDVVVKVKEYSQQMPGIEIKETTSRRYVDGSLAPHAVGVVGSITGEEYSAYNEAILEQIQEEHPDWSEEQINQEYQLKKYGYSDIIGKSGLEYAMEDELRGERGQRLITTTRRATCSAARSSSRRCRATPSSPPSTRTCSARQSRAVSTFWRWSPRPTRRMRAAVPTAFRWWRRMSRPVRFWRWSTTRPMTSPTTIQNTPSSAPTRCVR